jgi:hypothetical protein
MLVECFNPFKWPDDLIEGADSMLSAARCRGTSRELAFAAELQLQAIENPSRYGASFCGLAAFARITPIAMQSYIYSVLLGLGAGDVRPVCKDDVRCLI